MYILEWFLPPNEGQEVMPEVMSDGELQDVGINPLYQVRSD